MFVIEYLHEQIGLNSLLFYTASCAVGDLTSPVREMWSVDCSCIAKNGRYRTMMQEQAGRWEIHIIIQSRFLYKCSNLDYLFKNFHQCFH